MEEERIKLIETRLHTLLNSDFVKFDHVRSLTNIMGAYMIYDEWKKLVYIGSTNKFNIRFGTDLLNETTHTLPKKMIEKYHFINRAQYQEYLKHHCRYRIVQCKTKREAEAVEYYAIYVLDPPLNK